MIDNKSFKNTPGGKALKKLFQGDLSKVPPDQVDTLSDYLSILDAEQTLDLIKVLGADYHPWKGQGRGTDRVHSVSVSGNYRLLFQFDKARGYFFNLDYCDPH
ncbi:type II toxin-antitoxin system RelE/ParE family toxin [Chromohalobacter sp. 296-RDG]|uniref:type II toxin-antitoxin system RelE/ParE family toxin n=1 Tax=Chromohalobacter sp. 296-RDG TaxID=2994062 RepID=UPI00246853A1|nr:type II toxin-antitoxin system RelE/ParE family toxin [Chromohalobacter sp. 296-RDG]